ncbi:MAG TPA: HIT family protein, partial [Lachnospiraceae bacterium]|nr:HIT family protein [Lachnospiraceae bacterium]
HLIPRNENDSVNVTWKQGSYAEGEAEQVAAALAKRIKEAK